MCGRRWGTARSREWVTVRPRRRRRSRSVAGIFMTNVEAGGGGSALATTPRGWARGKGNGDEVHDHDVRWGRRFAGRPEFGMDHRDADDDDAAGPGAARIG